MYQCLSILQSVPSNIASNTKCHLPLPYFYSLMGVLEHIKPLAFVLTPQSKRGCSMSWAMQYWFLEDDQIIPGLMCMSTIFLCRARKEMVLIDGNRNSFIKAYS